jgi:hypothetical protein
MNLRDVRKKKKLDQFMRERDEAPTRDDAGERFQRLTRTMALGPADGKPPKP